MKKSRFTDSQIVAVLKEGEAGVPVAELCRKHSISSATYYNWKSKNMLVCRYQNCVACAM